MRVKKFSVKNNPSVWICGIFKFLHLRKIQTTRRVILCMSLPYFSVVYHTIMLNFIDKVLYQFESCFSRKASFRWFVTITIGFMLRSDKLGVTSVIRDLALSPDRYLSMIHFSEPLPGLSMPSAAAGSVLWMAPSLSIKKGTFISS